MGASKIHEDPHGIAVMDIHVKLKSHNKRQWTAIKEDNHEDHLPHHLLCEQ